MRRRREDRVDVCLATSHGGHLELMTALAPAYAHRSHVFVTPPSAQADALRVHGTRVVPVVNPQRRPLQFVRAAMQGLRAANALRPRVVVSSGAGAAVPFCVAAKLMGARLVFIENMARVHAGSVSGRLLYRLADRFLVEWPELRAVYPRAEVCRPALLETPAGPVAEGRGTFVAVGTHGEPFDRLVRLVDDAAARGLLPRPVRAQVGAARYPPRAFASEAQLAPEDVARAIRDSEVVVCHGGAGLISLAVRSGKTPLVLPRRREHGEHVDDHQVETVAKLDRLGAAVSLDETPLARALELVRRGRRPALGGEPRLVDRLFELIEAWV